MVNPRLRQIAPDEARKKLFIEMWTDRDYVCEYKYDGVRYLMHLGKKTSRFTSRRISVVTNKFVEKTKNFPHLSKHKFSFSLQDTIFDGEIIHKSTVHDVLSITGALPEKAITFQERCGYARYVVWDILFYRGKDTRSLPWHERHALLEHAVEIFNCKKYIKIPRVIRKNKKRYYDNVLKCGGEGVILKHVDSLYGTKSWVKAKRTETYDVTVTGYKSATQLTEKVDGVVSESKFYGLGYIGAIQFKEHKGNGHGYCSGMRDDVRKYISEHKKQCIGKLFEIQVQEKLPSGAFRHPRFKRWRPDK